MKKGRSQTNGSGDRHICSFIQTLYLHWLTRSLAHLFWIAPLDVALHGGESHSICFLYLRDREPSVPVGYKRINSKLIIFKEKRTTWKSKLGRPTRKKGFSQTVRADDGDTSDDDLNLKPWISFEFPSTVHGCKHCSPDLPTVSLLLLQLVQ